MKKTNSFTAKPFEVRIYLSLSNDLFLRFSALRKRLEKDFKIRLQEEALMDYICEKSIEKLEKWEEKTFSKEL